MGRSGGSGGRSSGGSSSHSRSSGGRSGGASRSPSRSSRGGASGSFSGGSFGHGRPPSGGFFVGSTRRPVRGYSVPPGGGYVPPPPNPHYGRRSAGGFGCSIYLLSFIIIVVAVIFVANMYGGDSRNEITKSTIEREALPAGSVNETGYYTDELNWIDNETTLLTGMKNFYCATGVQPYLYITNTVNGFHAPSEEELDVFANSLYDQLFTDEAHLLLVFFEYNNQYIDRYVCGTQAKTVIDQEAADILLDYIDKYYYDSSLTDAKFFSLAFDKAGERIMEVTTSPWIPVLIVLFILLLVVLLFTWWRRAKVQKNKEAEQMKEILNTPLEKFGDTEVEDLAKKYGDGSNAKENDSFE